MKKIDIVDEIMRVTWGYHGLHMDTIGKDFKKWVRSLVNKLSNADLAREARKCGITVYAKDIII